MKRFFCKSSQTKFSLATAEGIKKFAAAVIAFSCLTFSAYGQISTDENGVITVSGELGADNGEKMLSLDVYRGLDETGEKLLQLSPEEYLSYIVCHTQLMTDSEGRYEFSFKIPGDSGYLTTQIAVEGDSSPIRESGFYYVSLDEYNEAVEVFNNADTADKMLSCLTEYGMCLGLSSDDYDGLSDKRNCAGILSSMRNLCGTDKAKRAEFYNIAVYIQKLNENKISNIFVDNEYSGLDKSDIKDLYEAEFITDSLRKDMTERLSGKGFKNYASYQNEITKAFVLATVKNPNGYDNIKTVLSKLSDKIGISESLLTTENCKKIAGHSFETYKNLEAALKKEKETSSSGGGGGGGGGSSKENKNPGITVDAEIVDSQPVKEMKKDLFEDIENVSWAKEAIVALAEKGVINGKTSERFYPDDKITREEFVKIIVEAFDVKGTGQTNLFRDVDSSAWYAPYVCTAYESGVINGIESGRFGTGQNITREDIAVIIYRIAEKQGLFEARDEAKLFYDDASIADYAKTAVYTLKENEIISGNEKGNFMPKSYATRAEAAKIVYGLMRIQ